MAQDPVESPAFDEDAEGPVVLRRPMEDAVDMDITPMIDIVFLLLIFFLVCSTAASQMAVELPPARHGKGVSEQNSVVFSIEPAEGKGPATVYVGDATGDQLPEDLEAQEARIGEVIQQGIADGKVGVLIKAARTVKHREVSRVASVVGRIEGESDVKLYWAVLEVD
jgi:biopolymer transport protein ExbD